MSSASGELSLIGNILDENCQCHPRQSARCPAVGSGGGGSDGGGSWRKQNFRHEGLATVLRGVSDRIAQAASFSWRKSPLFSLRRLEGRWFGFVLWVLLCHPITCSFSHSACLWHWRMIASSERMIARFGWDAASAFAGICALSYLYYRPIYRTS